MKIVHILPRMHRGGAVRSTIDLAHEHHQTALVESYIVVLGAHDLRAVEWARRAGIQVILRHDVEKRRQVLREADILHVEFWNTPEMYSWLQSPLPPARLVITLHIAGEFPAQVITAPLLEFADWIVAATPYTLGLPVFRQLPEARADRVRVILGSTILPESDIVVPPHNGTRIGYAGMIDFVKMHSRFIELCAAVNNAQVTFPVAGEGAATSILRRRAERLGVSARFDWVGYSENVRAFLASCDLFGYPLCRDTYAASELIVQEAMSLGVPPVVLPYGGLSTLVTHDETGLVVSENEYSVALQALAGDSSHRARLASNARAYAQEYFGAAKMAQKLQTVYECALRSAKHERAWRGSIADEQFPGASALIQAFGVHGAAYRASLAASDSASACAADMQIASASPVEYSAGGGGILDYRNTYPNDPLLRLWSGLVLAKQAHIALAAAEFHTAQEMGLGERAGKYLQRMLDHQPLFQNAGSSSTL